MYYYRGCWIKETIKFFIGFGPYSVSSSEHLFSIINYACTLLQEKVSLQSWHICKIFSPFRKKQVHFFQHKSSLCYEWNLKVLTHIFDTDLCNFDIESFWCYCFKEVSFPPNDPLVFCMQNKHTSRSPASRLASLQEIVIWKKYFFSFPAFR